MVKWQGAAFSVRRQLAWKLMTSVAILCLAAACTKTGNKGSLKAQLSQINYTQQAKRPPLKPNHPLYIATTYWARQHQKNPKDPTAALNYARNLKVLGSKERAVEVLARTYQLNPGHGELASEFGRLALSLGKVEMAEKLLNQARKASRKKDWRVLSALGTVNSKRGDHKKAQTLYLAALREQPGATSLYNNLALSYALDGRAGDAETLLKKAIAKGHDTPRVRQNLALVLGLQTKFGEARQIAQADLSGDKVASDVRYLKSMVKTTKVARASKPAGKSKHRAGSIITAALPSAKKTAHKTTSRRVKTAAAHKNPAAGSAPPAQAIQIPARKPGKPAPKVKMASARNAAGARANQRAQSLPWHKKPGAPKPAREVRLASMTLVKPPTRIAPHAGVTTWSTSVSRGNAPRSSFMQVLAAASTKSSDFEIPETE